MQSIHQAIAALEAERDKLSQAIEALNKFVAPTQWAASWDGPQIVAAVAKPASKPRWPKAARAAAAKRMRAYWAAKKRKGK